MAHEEEAWERQALAYQAYFEDNDARVSSRQVFPRLVELLGDVAGLRVLDLGCGPGRFSRALHDLGARVTAYDRSIAEIELARRADGGRGMTYSTGDGALEIEGAYDAVLCFMVLLCNRPDEAAALVATIHKVLVPGGRAYFVNSNTAALGRRFPDFWSPPLTPGEQVRGAAYRTTIPTSKGDIEAVDHYYSPADLRGLFAEVGFQVDHEAVIAEQFVLHGVSRA